MSAKVAADGTPEVEAVNRELLRQLPIDAHGPLVCGPDARKVSATKIRDATWMENQLGLRGEIWRTTDVPVLATLWWYSASHFLVTPSIASLILTGRALSPRLEDLMVHHQLDSRVSGASSTALAGPGDQIQALAITLAEMFDELIPQVASLARRSEQAMWALATDSLASQALLFGRALHQVPAATRTVSALIEAIDRPMPPARFIDVAPPPLGILRRRLVHRQSCCLLYRVPGESLCSSCPRRHPDLRRDTLGTPLSTPE
ncbi:(2Fe-2S)-binding protein [Nakamurella antarctica]|uniref:(2Fe-2S)-binding protein n=1 Tax=Nakamurella antarctica TaxID=1902245 RepID=A0A3G8ZIQ7_9ACTN|nr:(2Fe-2S)-binding protein [Nakamurella antarctica]AZI57213.1 (2Fe-2S)-binding protein [Nakamurella antarctica]